MSPAAHILKLGFDLLRNDVNVSEQVLHHIHRQRKLLCVMRLGLMRSGIAERPDLVEDPRPIRRKNLLDNRIVYSSDEICANCLPIITDCFYKCAQTNASKNGRCAYQRL